MVFMSKIYGGLFYLGGRKGTYNGYSSNLSVIATGGLAPLIKSEAKTIDHIEEFLTLDGLKIIFELNLKGQAGNLDQ